MPQEPAENRPEDESPIAGRAAVQTEQDPESCRDAAAGSRLFKRAFFIWLPCLVILVVAFLLFRPVEEAGGSGRRPDTPPAENATVRRDVAKRPSGEVEKATAPPAGDALPYEEALGGPLEESIKRVDYALIQNMLQLGYESDRMRLDHVETRSRGGVEHHFQRLDLILDEGPEGFVENLKPLLEFWADEAVLEQVNATTWRIAVLQRPTHELDFFRREDIVPGPDHFLAVKGPKIVVVIDDLGESPSFARDLVDLGIPITFAIWPRASHVREVASIAREAGMEIIVHQPMEPVAYPKMQPGPGAVYVRMTPEEIEATVSANLDLVPGAVGLNNHMGSRFTQDGNGTAAVARVLKARGLMALDSLTHPRSVFRSMAKSLGVPSNTRDVFLDVVRSKRSVLHQLIKAERIAQKKGQAVAIGHPFPETLAGLREWVQTRDGSVTPVNLATLVASGTSSHARVEKSPETR
ncbi:hypothetical protein DPQ33_09215 [Oceanidesulfovibrio indonesiensis]|uniref:Divergent polysaccharide deacetylase family protein n=1 Tax=Oceanidesulfovibrio indonesiensis TaxID=54767 RepID=A0A7M3MFE5_9BACT|nr:divergent polysaccharide deacetylase family protein [Oceanidesulfovibrio indonesiensis]TVM17352.1 hypothetical protein DPQ33_09215 [Oceanidesulfovibrio indonesiensis]